MQCLTSLLFLGSALAAPTSYTALEERATQQCGQYQQQSNGGYTLSTNGWGWSSGTGSQCSEINSVSGTTIAWDTTWSWSGTATQVKSYTNVQSGFTQKQLSQYSTIPTTWKWSYTGTSLAANVAYDTFVGSSASGANLFEVMVWLGLYGSISPLSANGYPFTSIATVTVGGIPFDLAYGLNGNVKVYSFVAHSHAATSFTGDLMTFYKYLATNYASNGFSLSLYLQVIQAGTEVFTGSNAKLTTSAYSISAT
ncbi:hypothetical protein LTR56_016249 [Elasticomyces elasticus]|nr:hypothetical protein LTR56_016249 [Elasticomyces elasticus]KAK3636091.1 hypothetical protein LTR22_018938 [Elasticomyces elasticus]KAK5751369.1 hypothetical protein LTS12_018527 [Elasticomyces elasticus]